MSLILRQYWSKREYTPRPKTYPSIAMDTQGLIHNHVSTTMDTPSHRFRMLSRGPILDHNIDIITLIPSKALQRPLASSLPTPPLCAKIRSKPWTQGAMAQPRVAIAGPAGAFFGRASSPGKALFIGFFDDGSAGDEPV